MEEEEEDDGLDELDQELALFVRKFSKVLKSKRGGYGMRGKRDRRKKQ